MPTWQSMEDWSKRLTLPRCSMYAQMESKLAQEGSSPFWRIVWQWRSGPERRLWHPKLWLSESQVPLPSEFGQRNRRGCTTKTRYEMEGLVSCGQRLYTCTAKGSICWSLWQARSTILLDKHDGPATVRIDFFRLSRCPVIAKKLPTIVDQKFPQTRVCGPHAEKEAIRCNNFKNTGATTEFRLDIRPMFRMLSQLVVLTLPFMKK